MSKESKGPEKTARNDLERITIFRSLADEYLELIDSVGNIHEDLKTEEQAKQNRTALSLRLMLERKFVTTSDKNTFIPKIINALKRLLNEDQITATLEAHQDAFDKIVSGESTGVSANLNNVELDFVKIRQVFSYGRLMHADRDKHISSIILADSFFNLLVRQSRLLADIIAALRDLIVVKVESGAIPETSESLRETWHQILADPEFFELGTRMHSDEIPALRDDGTQPLPGGLRKRTVSFIMPVTGYDDGTGE